MHKQKKIDAGYSSQMEESPKLGKAAKFYELADDPEGCHRTKVDHVVARLEQGI